MPVTYSWSLAKGGAVAAAPSAPGGGFVSRPYLYQNDKTRLLASMTANDAEAFGSTSNAFNTPMAFITLMENAYVSAGRGSYPITGSFNDISTWQLAFAGWLKQEFAGNGNAMMDVAKNECLAFVAAHNGSPIISGDEYQHIEDIMRTTAMVVDCCYDRFSAGERSTVATWVNDCMTYAGTQNRNFWPSVGYPSDEEAVNNNYHQNHLLALAIAGICSEGWNASASTWRTKFEDWAGKYVAYYNGATWTGAQVSEGRYYAQYVRHALWAMQLYDSVMGTAYETDLGAAGPSSARQLNLGLYHLQPNLNQNFHDGSEANDTGAHLNTTGFGALSHHAARNPSSTDARVMKTILQDTDLSATYSWARSIKGFENFYWNLRPISALAVTSKTDRKLSLPSPGGARVFLRSASSWGGASTDRACVMFFSRLNWADESGFSHANPDSPGFQWSQGADKIACDVEQDGPSGIAHEAGSSTGSAWGNYVGLNSAANPPSSGDPVILYDEDNTGSGVSHYYQSVNAQPQWTNATTYRRQYVWLDDLQVLCVHDRVVTSGSDTKTWRLHTMSGTPSVAGSEATWTTGSTSIRVRDLYTTDGTSMTGDDVTDANSGTSVRRLSQTGTSNDWRSLKVIDINSRCSAASLSSGSGYLQADMTINGASRSVQFFDDGSHVVVS